MVGDQLLASIAACASSRKRKMQMQQQSSKPNLSHKLSHKHAWPPGHISGQPISSTLLPAEQVSSF
jgi:hypothetical protein